MIIAVDGPVAAGKGTLARRIAQKYKLTYLDTGALYRAVGLILLRAGQDPENATLAAQAALSVSTVALDDQELRREETGKAASVVAANQQVRDVLLNYQRSIAKQRPGAVLDGRDIGTVVCPDADIKLFVTASSEARARRRYDELIARGEDVLFDDVLADLQERDRRDQGRSAAPLTKAEDAHLLDTTKLDIEAALEAACQLIDAEIR
ncbi:MAG: (d)CMP kinase [Sneathiella sp.]